MSSDVNRAVLARVIGELPGTLLLAVTTAVVTLLLLLLISVFLGGENSQHRIAQRCGVWLLREVMIEFAAVHEPQLNVTEFPAISIEGLDCSGLFEPLEPNEH